MAVQTIHEAQAHRRPCSPVTSHNRSSFLSSGSRTASSCSSRMLPSAVRRHRDSREHRSGLGQRCSAADYWSLTRRHRPSGPRHLLRPAGKAATEPRAPPVPPSRGPLGLNGRGGGGDERQRFRGAQPGTLDDLLPRSGPTAAPGNASRIRHGSGGPTAPQPQHDPEAELGVPEVTSPSPRWPVPCAPRAAEGRRGCDGVFSAVPRFFLCFLLVQALR